MRLTLLGTGTSFGVPQIGCSCAVCHSADPRDRRSRTAALVEGPDGTLLIDTPPELRLQLVAAAPATIDAVLYTHAHADHINGIDDLRMFSVKERRAVPLHGPAHTIEYLRRSFTYIFDDAVTAFDGTSKPRLTLQPLAAGTPVRVAGYDVLPLEFEHGHMRVFGYRIGALAYITDVKAVPEAARAQLRGLDTLILNALWWREHPTHLSIPEAIAVARDLAPRRTFLTHLTHETGHAALAAELPEGIAPAYDGLVLEVP